MPITLPTKAASPPQRIRFEDDIFTLPTTLIPIARGLDRFLHNNMPYSFSLEQDSSESRRLPASSTLASVCTSLKCLGCITTYSPLTRQPIIQRVRKPSARVVIQDDDFQLSL